MDTQVETKTKESSWRPGTRFCYMQGSVYPRKSAQVKQRAAITAAFSVVNANERTFLIAGFAFCSPEDFKSQKGQPGFRKEVGRDLAYQRLLDSPIVIPVRRRCKPPKALEGYISTTITHKLWVPGLPSRWYDWTLGSEEGEK